MPVQYVIRPISDKFPDYRGYAGRLASGVLHVGERVRVLPSGMESHVKAIYQAAKTMEKAFAPESVSVLLEDDIDISRGDFIVSAGHAQPQVSKGSNTMCLPATLPFRKINCNRVLPNSKKDNR